ncbi:hypothetical protein [Sinomonas notoginsengisoli]|nr:hypothetical protein [Sinomonas notoginsengisoli]
MSTTALAQPKARTIDVERLAQTESHRGDVLFSEPLGLHHGIR